MYIPHYQVGLIYNLPGKFRFSSSTSYLYAEPERFFIEVSILDIDDYTGGIPTNEDALDSS